MMMLFFNSISGGRRHRFLPLLLLVHLLLCQGIEVRWTPADDGGPEPASAKYREQMAKLRELQAQQSGDGQHPSQQQPQQDVGLLDYLIYYTFSSVRGIKIFAIKHPRIASLSTITALAGYRVHRSAQKTGLLLSRRPYVCAFRPPVTFLADLLDEKLPGAVSTNALGGRASKGYKATKAAAEEARCHELMESVNVGKGEVTYGRAVHLIQSLKVLDGLPGDIRFFTTFEGRQGIFLLKHRGFWRLMPVRITKQGGRVKKGKKVYSKKKWRKAKREVYEEILMESLKGSPWKGELRISASWSDPEKGGDDSVTLEVAWFTSTHSKSTTPPKKEFVGYIISRASELIDREMTIYRVREKQQQALAQDAKRAALERARKEREKLLNPEPNQKQWKKLHRGSAGVGKDGPTRWQPSSDLQARRNPRRGG